ncbi:DUF4105 domain-containing protein [Pseudobacteriovorax antillogorgiicola]|uniref:Lnb N-terminal periplasmic domain-containing protein n=1 Tax=Pseudobacteriovorax antillogorgiicola TaxID=1513793 RepID=UPI001F17EE45|nr:DUF4105 domain-containing protein [Pseudobacteriovorax antillogorgiicola]
MWLLLRVLISEEAFADSRLTALDPQWLRLLHYQKSLFGYESTIDHPSFFFHPEGNSDPVAEKAATIQFMNSGKKLRHKGQYIDPICLFPARYRFLEKFIRRKKPHCEGIAHWRTKLALESISLVYASAYENNPSSLFGHTFIKLNLKRQQGYDYLNYGLSFAAALDPNDGLLYIVKGMVGGYYGVFSLEPYYKMVNEYNLSENRSLWEYEISLSEPQRLLFIEHIWELYQTALIDYYFIDDNCASILLEIIDVLFPNAMLADKTGVFVSPHQIVSILVENISLTSIKYKPSLRDQVLYKISHLPNSQVRSLVASIDQLNMQNDQIASPAYLDAQLDLITYKKRISSWDEQQKIIDFENQVLLKVASIDQPVPSKALRSASNDPSLGHKVRKVRLGLSMQGDRWGPEFRFKYGFHDILDSYKGFEPHYQVNYLDIKAFYHSNFNYDASLIHILALNEDTAFDTAWAWEAGGGVYRPDGLAYDAAYFTGGIGKAQSWAWHGQWTVFGLLSADLSYGSSEWLAPLYMKLGVLSRWNHRIRSLFQSHFRLFSLGNSPTDRDDKTTISMETRLELDESRQIRIALQRSRYESNISFGIAKFF